MGKDTSRAGSGRTDVVDWRGSSRINKAAEQSMNRRRFLRQVMLYSSGLSLSLPLFRIPESLAFNASVPDVVRVSGEDYAALVKKTVELLGSMSRFVKPGYKVVVKPNIGWDRKPEQAANTHPQVVTTLVELALEAGADEVKVFDYTCNEKRRCYNNSGMEWDIYKDALTADCYINVPVAKHHGLSRLTLGLKNSMGVIGGRRGALHHDLGQNLADLATVITPQLTIIDATRILTNNGPQGGSIEDVRRLDTLIGSVDPVAVDALATTLFDLRPEDISSTVAAHQMGLGQMDPAKMNIISGSV